MKTNDSLFNEAYVLHELVHFLPSQTPLKDFIHHNPLHAFQGDKFYDAIFKASKIFGYQVTLQLSDYRKLLETGRINQEILDKVITERKGKDNFSDWKNKVMHVTYDEHTEAQTGYLRACWKENFHIDIDSMVHPLLFRILASYLDQGISIWNFPLHPDGFLASFKQLEKESFSSFFKTKRAKLLLLNNDLTLSDLLKIIVGDEAYFAQYLYDQQFGHRGWSGMVATVEAQPKRLMNAKKITLKEVILLELLLEIDALDFKFGSSWASLSTVATFAPIDILHHIENTELNEIFKIWQDAFEWTYYDTALAGIEVLKEKPKHHLENHSFKAVFCIDERECSIRRHIEMIDHNCETLGMPGFFGVEFYFQPYNAKFYDKLCPAPVTPAHLIKEEEFVHKRPHDMLYTNSSHTLLGGYLSSIVFGFWAIVRLIGNLFRPKMSPAISNAFAHMHKDSKLTILNKNINDRENDLQIGFTIDEMSSRVENALRGIGLIQDFSPIVYLIAHGSSSANNPHHGAHDCGACSGRPGSVNARVMSFMANNELVRQKLKTNGIDIPYKTQFVGGLHDTASDQIEFFDIDILNASNKVLHVRNAAAFEQALDLNAKERSRRFASINTKANIKKVRKEIIKRSVSLFEPRPELGHGTNSLCIIGKRCLSKGLFFDRRAFMNSYDYTTDADGKLLAGIMRPIGPVCGGINLEYYFSRVDNQKLGAGTKLPHNVIGLIGVANSSDGDLRPGLPLQMIEVHDPIRLMVIVEHSPVVVLKTIQSDPDMYEWYNNEWVHLAVADPITNQLYYFKNGQFTIYHTVTKALQKVAIDNALIEAATEMETNHIVDATKENLPVYLIE